jgi:hypothetical protein
MFMHVTGVMPDAKGMGCTRPYAPPQCAFGTLSQFGVLPMSSAPKLRFSCPICSTMLSYMTMAASGPLHSVPECRKMLLNVTLLPL